MASSGDPPNRYPPSMGPGARPMQPGETPGSLLKEISDIRSNYSVHVDSEAINLAYKINDHQRSYRLLFDNIPLYGLQRNVLYSRPRSTFVSGVFLIDLIRACENISGRPLSQQEAESFAFYTSKRMMTMFAGNIMGIGIGYTMAWRGRKDMKFPFMKPKPAEKYENFPNRFLPIIKGQYARTMWHITRANVYAALGILVLTPFARSMGNTSMVVGLYRDGRTHELMKSMKGGLDRLQSNRAQSGVPGIVQKQGDMAGAGDGSDQQTFYGSEDTYGGQQDYPSDTSFTDSSTDTEVMNDRMTEQRQARQPPPNSWGKAQARANSPPQPQLQTQSSSSDFFFNDDDASPTAGNDPNMATPAAYSRQSSGSAWDRIRRGRQTQTQPNPSQQTQQSGGWQRGSMQGNDAGGDDFSYSKGSEERQLAKDQAQKEFDAMLERERHQGGSSEHTKGMQATEAGMESTETGGSAWERRRRG